MGLLASGLERGGSGRIVRRRCSRVKPGSFDMGRKSDIWRSGERLALALASEKQSNLNSKVEDRE